MPIIKSFQQKFERRRIFIRLGKTNLKVNASKMSFSEIDIAVRDVRR